MSAILGHTEPMIEIELVRWAISRRSDIRRCHGYRSENARVLPRTKRTKRTSADREHKLYGRGVGGKKSLARDNGDPELNVRVATGARHLHPSDNTPTTERTRQTKND